MPDSRKISEASRHVAEAERHVAEQRARLERMRRLGLPTAEAERLLRLLVETLAEMRRHLEQLCRA